VEGGGRDGALSPPEPASSSAFSADLSDVTKPKESDDEKFDQEDPGRSLPALLLVGLVYTGTGVLVGSE